MGDVFWLVAKHAQKYTLTTKRKENAVDVSCHYFTLGGVFVLYD
jgi:hypothetical protein